jgi:hypothetical protein
MKQIDIFTDKHGRDYRWDLDKNAKLLNIVFSRGTFGNFLKYFLDKFSSKTKDIEGDPFTELGTSHTMKKHEFSGLIQRYHQSFINDNQGEEDLPICLIMPTNKKHFLYLKKSQWFRAGDHKISPDDLWKKAVGEMPESIIDHAKEIIKLYDIKDAVHFTWIPKFIIRDWYKLEFLQDLKDTYNYHWFDTFKKHPFFEEQRVFNLDLETFFDWQTFIVNIAELNDVFSLDLDFDRMAEMKQIFEKGLALDQIRMECNLAEDVLEQGLDRQLKDLDVATEAYIYAEVEKKNDFIQMPLTNRFFRDTAEIDQFVEHYPIHYKAMNPNMPEFNGIPNPYYLDKNK